MDTLPSQIPRLSPHELWHTCGTALRQHGLDIYTIQQYLGCRDIEVTANTCVHSTAACIVCFQQYYDKFTTKCTANRSKTPNFPAYSAKPAIRFLDFCIELNCDYT